MLIQYYEMVKRIEISESEVLVLVTNQRGINKVVRTCQNQVLAVTDFLQTGRCFLP